MRKMGGLEFECLWFKRPHEVSGKCYLFLCCVCRSKAIMACILLLFKMPTINKTYLILSYFRQLALYQ
jgi:hypothetical protein